MYLIKQVSKISGVSVRTLHHYDAIGLLCPQKHENGYRYYSENEISILQSILFYKYLGFSLAEIKELLQQNKENVVVHFKKQLALMQKEKQRLLTLIQTLEQSIVAEERKIKMPNDEKFKGFVYAEHTHYKQEAEEKYGKEAIENSYQKHKGKEQEMIQGLNEIFFAFAENKQKELASTDKENLVLAKKLHKHICEYAFECKLEVFSAIAYGYVENDAFKTNINKFGEDMAQYICDAVQEYVKVNTR